jgi:4-hydroxybenzoate polyprenyltransferase
MGIKPYLQLIRLPNVFTAAADSLAGWLLVGGSLDEPAGWLPRCGASMALYAAGIVLNDLYDREIDRAERPSRPLPSGRVSLTAAWVLAVILFLLGLELAVAAGRRAGAVGVFLGVTIIAYDIGLKRTVLGPLAMGACRGLNGLLGLSLDPRFGGPPGWMAAGSIALFVVGLTWISRSETRAGETAGPIAGWVLQNMGLLGLFGAAMQARHFPAPAGSAGRPIVPLEGLLVLLIVAAVVNAATGAAVREPVPGRLQKAVKTGVMALVWLNVGIVAAVRGPFVALAVAALWLPAFFLGKWFYST